MRAPPLSVAVAVLASLLVQGCGGLFYQPSRIVYTDPAGMGVRWRESAIPRPGGGSLAAAIVDQRGTDSSKGLLVLFHGNAQNMTAHWTNLAWAVRKGWTLTTWDYSGYGASDGVPTRKQVARDADAFLGWVSDSVLPRHRGPVVLVGQSLGSAIMLRAFVRWKDRGRTTLVVSEGGFASYRSMAKDVASRHWLLWPAYPFVALFMDDSESPASILGQIPPNPFLVVSCAQDAVVPPPHQRRIHESAPESWIWSVDGCRHIGAFRSTKIRYRFEALVDSLAFPPR